MPRMSDEKWSFIEDSRDKKITARSARHTRTHNGKGGRVKLPCDYLSAKEIKKMSGECKSYRLNDPLKKSYIKALRAKYNVPDIALAEMFGVTQFTVSAYLRGLGLGLGKNGRKRTWNKDGFYIWRDGVKKDEPTPIEEEAISLEITSEEVEAVTVVGECDNRGAVPTNGTLTFEGESKDILRTIGDILRDRYVRLTVQWAVTDAPDVAAPVTLDTSALTNAGKVIDYAILNRQRREAAGSKG